MVSLPWWTLAVPALLACVYMVLTLSALWMASFHGARRDKGARGEVAPFVSAPMAAVRKMLAGCRIEPGDVVVDLGCGDGRVLFEAERSFGAEAIGYEGAVLPYWLACLWRTYYRSSAKIVRGDFWNADLADADVVTLFLLPRTLNELEEKLRTELRPGAQVVTLNWQLKGWKYRSREYIPSGFTRMQGPKLTPIYFYTVSNA